MTVKDLLEVIKNNEKNYPDFLDWIIALEQHPNYKKCCNCNKSEDSITVIDSDGTKTLFIKSHAMKCCTYSPKDKVFGIQIHY
jgi:hypothetical protein